MPFTLIGEVGLNPKPFFRGLLQIESRAEKTGKKIGKDLDDSFKRRLKSVFGVGALTLGTKSLVDQAGAIRAQSKSVNLSTEAWQRNRFAVEQANVPVEKLNGALRGFVNVIKSARNGNKEHIATLERLGLAQKDLQNNDFQFLFEKVSDDVKDSKIDLELMGDLITAFGEQGLDLIPAMKDGFKEMGDEAERLGVVIKDDVIQELAAFGDELTNQGFRAKAFFSNVAAGAIRLTKTVSRSIQQTLGGAIVRYETLLRTGSIEQTRQTGRAFDQAFFEDIFAKEKAIRNKGKVDRNFNSFTPKENEEEKKKESSQRSQESRIRQASGLASLGLFVGGNTSQALNVQAQQLAELKAMKFQIRDMKNALRRGGLT